jgi:transcriptional regulator with PAS, ATPase and Fis domain
LGESGTGKELAARAVHHHSTRADKSFIAYNCSSISREIAESQMFGHRKGAFTGAHQDSLGVIRSAEGGTLFLDEIGDLSLEIQPKLLRFLENGEVHPVGTTGVVRTNIRVVAATNQDLSRMVTEGKFRADLWYRINTITITLPPLRERREDIPLLVHHLLRKLSSSEGKQDIRLTPGFVEELMLYHWPGNIRELANVIEQVVAFTPSGGVIESFQFAPYVRQQLPAVTLPALVTTPLQLEDPDIYADLVHLEDVSRLTLSHALAALEQRMIKDALAYNHNNISKTAVTLGLSRFGLQRKLKRLLT